MCLTSHAIHLDIVDSLSMDTCTNAIERFLSQYVDVTRALYSDTRTKFHGVDNSICNMYNTTDHQKYQRYYRLKRNSWYFNIPLASPHAGAWERLICSVCCLLSALQDDPQNKTFSHSCSARYALWRAEDSQCLPAHSHEFER